MKPLFSLLLSATGTATLGKIGVPLMECAAGKHCFVAKSLAMNEDRPSNIGRILRVQGNKKKVKERGLLQAGKGVRQDMTAFVEGARRVALPMSSHALFTATNAMFAIQRAPS